jgi:hypothetical protein
VEKEQKEEEQKEEEQKENNIKVFKDILLIQ